MSLPASPCIGLCQADATSGTCTGCRRTLDEISRWSGMTTPERQAVLERLATSRATPDRTCPQCGTAFSCGTGGRSGGCWCQDLPAMLPVPEAAASCLCPDCLGALINNAENLT